MQFLAVSLQQASSTISPVAQLKWNNDAPTDALIRLSLSKLILNPQCKEGAREDVFVPFGNVI